MDDIINKFFLSGGIQRAIIERETQEKQRRCASYQYR